MANKSSWPETMIAGNMMAGLLDLLFNSQNTNGNDSNDGNGSNGGNGGKDGQAGQIGSADPIDDDTNDVPLWVTNRALNNTESPLYRIPDNVAVLIYAQMDEVTMHILRQTSSLFRNTLVPSKTTGE